MIDRKISFAFSLPELGLLNAEPDQDLDNLTQLASSMLNTPISLLSIIDHENERQVFKSQCGLSEPLASKAETPISHSFCQHVVSRNKPLIVADARQHPLVKNNPAIDALGVNAYLGVPVHTPDGTPVGALCVISETPQQWSLANQTTLTRLAACVNDLVRLRAANRHTQKLRDELQDFSSALSHDIKSPIRSMVMFHREIEEELGDSISPDVKQLLDMCHVATDKATQLIEHILGFTRLFDNVSAFEPVDLHSLAKEVLDSFDERINRSNAAITLKHLPTISGDRVLLTSLLWQLVSNALTYTHPQSPACVEISSRISSDGKTATLSIKDSGIGIAPQFHERVFRLFERLHLKSEFSGHGIGLTLCQRIVSIHSGAIEIQSNGNSGTDILVDLPVKSHE